MDAVAYEELLSRDPYAVSTWHAYANSISAESLSLNHQIQASRQRCAILKRAVQYTPRSYKLWIRALEEKNRIAKAVPIVVAPL
jgi:hypothetical protein